VAITWQNESLVYFLERESGMNAYTPSRTLAGSVSEVPQEPEASLPTISYREEVLTHSRETYALPREEVERQIAELNGWEIPEEFATEEEKARNELLHRLCTTGMERGQAHDILDQYPVDVIRRQLDWLPYRGARYPARFLVSAIAGDYDAPPRQYRVRQTEPGATEESDEEFPLDLESSP
ncbi:MAG: hypothetical protein NT023_01015, partial [Armatimonadetes bacterium]|nr:hypothetical protein [Armatimonadota bacterium]